MNKGVFKRVLNYAMTGVLARILLLFLLFTIFQDVNLAQNFNVKVSVGETGQDGRNGLNGIIDPVNGNTIITGAEQTELYLPQLQGKRVGMIVNHSSMVGNTHLVDILLSKGIDVKKIFAPEHGFRGMADAGETVKNNTDNLTGLPVLSLYGDHKKPTPEDLQGLDIIVFDIQDVGARFYTYISTMSLAMEACAEQGLEFMVLDRPNPNGHYIDGPVLDPTYSSFVGMHPVPVVHGMTVGEYAMMVNQEKWLKNGIYCKLKVIMCRNYTHRTVYEPPVKPSPNLPDIKSIYLYPSLCFFEGTYVSVGRGTDHPFQVFGAPEFKGKYKYSFTPESRPGAKTPPQMGKTCYGEFPGIQDKSELRNICIDLSWLIEMYKSAPVKEAFFNDFFTKLAGGPTLQKQIVSGMPWSEIKKSWEPGLAKFKAIREKYLLYPE